MSSKRRVVNLVSLLFLLSSISKSLLINMYFLLQYFASLRNVQSSATVSLPFMPGWVKSSKIGIY